MLRPRQRVGHGGIDHSRMYFVQISSIRPGPNDSKINRKVTRVGTSEVYVPTHVALRMFIMQVLASQLHFLAKRNAGLAIPSLFWPVNCVKIGGHVALLSGRTVHSLYCAAVLQEGSGAEDVQCDVNYMINGGLYQSLLPVKSNRLPQILIKKQLIYKLSRSNPAH